VNRDSPAGSKKLRAPASSAQSQRGEIDRRRVPLAKDGEDGARKQRAVAGTARDQHVGQPVAVHVADRGNHVARTAGQGVRAGVQRRRPRDRAVDPEAARSQRPKPHVPAASMTGPA
jgi:hypothetical protein